ncbi:MAG: head maturation protease, ClpP-related [Cyanobacteria bacterium P01_H01_bin.74]
MTNWFDIAMKGAQIGEVRIYDVIGKDYYDDGSAIEAKKFIDAIKTLGNLDELTIRINSPGGSVFEGTAIYNFLKQSSMRISVVIDGLAASMASVIAMAGDSVAIPENALLMIHNPSAGVHGNAAEMRKTAKILDKMAEGARLAYRRSGKTETEIAQMMDRETWMTGKEAVEMGFADILLNPLDATACASFDLNRYKNIPETVSKRVMLLEPELISHNKTIEEDKTVPLTLDELKKSNPDLVKQIKAESNVEAVEVERDRIQTILSMRLKGHEKVIEEAITSGASASDVAVTLLKSVKSEQEATAAAVLESQIAPIENTIKSLDAETEKTPISLEEAKEYWMADPALRKKFSRAENYWAFVKYHQNLK